MEHENKKVSIGQGQETDTRQPLKDLLLDFVFEMEDGSWKHLEFESDSISLEDLRRYRAYEAMASHIYQVEVTTYVICTCKVEHLQSELQEGINTYQVKVIRLKDSNADALIEELEAIQTERETLGQQDIQRMEAVMYSFALKLLTEAEVNEIREVLKMTEFARSLVQEGLEKGESLKLLQLVSRKVQKGYNAAAIADDLEEERDVIERLYQVITENPDSDIEGWYEILTK